MKNEKHTKYRFLIHCRYPQIREGFEENIRSLPVDYETFYMNLKENGFLNKLRLNPHLIIILQNESDAELLLPLKIKLFAPEVPLLLVLPHIPDAYREHLNSIGVNKIIELPAKKETINQEIEKMLEINEELRINTV